MHFQEMVNRCLYSFSMLVFLCNTSEMIAHTNMGMYRPSIYLLVVEWCWSLSQWSLSERQECTQDRWHTPFTLTLYLRYPRENMQTPQKGVELRTMLLWGSSAQQDWLFSLAEFYHLRLFLFSLSHCGSFSASIPGFIWEASYSTVYKLFRNFIPSQTNVYFSTPCISCKVCQNKQYLSLILQNSIFVFQSSWIWIISSHKMLVIFLHIHILHIPLCCGNAGLICFPSFS